MDTTPVSRGVLEGLDRFIALTSRPEIAALKKDYEDRASLEARRRSAQEELQAAESALVVHGAPHEPSAIVDEEVLADMDARLRKMQAARAKFSEARDAETA
jgi:FKBP-type peptidyl-prolyl cis-trans isomerase (trigger factor)